MHGTIVLVVSLWSLHQLLLCQGKESLPTILPYLVKAKYIRGNADGSSRSINTFARMLRIEVAKQEILRKLGMKKRPPKMSNLLSTIPKPVFDGEIGSMYSNSEDEEPTKTTQVVIPAEEGDTIDCSSKENCYNFHLSKKIFQNQIIEFATLQLFKDSTGPVAHKIKLEDYGPVRKPIARSRVQAGRGWISIRMEKTIEDWAKHGKRMSKILSFRISCQDCTRASDFQVSSKPRYRPFLLLKISEVKDVSIRKRRSFSVDCIPGYDKCCRQHLYVTFKEIGWHDWIIEPSGFEINVCNGQCSGSTINVARSHGFVKKELMKKKKNKFLSVCCVPTKFSRLTLLHFDEDGFIFKTRLENMVVKECGCM